MGKLSKIDLTGFGMDKELTNFIRIRRHIVTILVEKRLAELRKLIDAVDSRIHELCITPNKDGKIELKEYWDLKYRLTRDVEEAEEMIRKKKGDRFPVINPDDLRTKYYRWTDEEFVIAANKLKTLSPMERIEYVYEHSNRIALFEPHEREINGMSYSYGILLEDYAAAQSVGWHFANEESKRWFAESCDRLYRRIFKCQEQWEKLNLVKDEIEKIEERLEPAKQQPDYLAVNGFAYGFLTEKRKENRYFVEAINPYHFKDIRETKFNGMYCLDVVHGIASYRIWRECQNIKNALEIQQPILNTDPDDERIANVTVADQLMRELGIIEHIFKAQYKKVDPNDAQPYPTILNATGEKHIDGRYLHHIMIYSPHEFLNMQSYKKEFIARFENAVTINLLKNQLQDIRDKAFYVMDWYNKNLTANAEIVIQFKALNDLPIEEEIAAKEEHTAIVTLLSLTIREIYIGKVIGESSRTTRFGKINYRYLVSNKELDDACGQLIYFIDSFRLGLIKKEKVMKINASIPSSLTELFVNKADFEKSISALVTIQVITPDGENLIGTKLKSAIQVWIYLLREKKLIKEIPDNKLPDLLNNYFIGLGIGKDGRTFRNAISKVGSQYKRKLLEYI